MSPLKLTERLGATIGARIASGGVPRALATLWQDHAAVPVLNLTINDRLHTHGLDNLPRGESFILAANHRTWFDLYAVLLAIWRHFDQPPHLYCPVRSTFFYERLTGIALNLAVSGNAMYPPIFRDERGRSLNHHAVELAADLLRTDPRCVLAIHPEGRRGKDPDPYTFLEARPGVGRIALRAQRPIVPLFVAGLPPTFPALVKERASGRGQPVRVTLGPPIALDDLADRSEDPEAWVTATTRTMAGIAAAGELDRAFMAARGG